MTDEGKILTTSSKPQQAGRRSEAVHGYPGGALRKQVLTRRELKKCDRGMCCVAMDVYQVRSMPSSVTKDCKEPRYPRKR